MSNVIALTKPLPRIWVCACGCSTFELFEDGEAKCAICGTQPETGGWSVPETKAEYDGDPIKDVSGNGSVEFARARVRKLASQEDALLLIVASEDGVTVWSAAETAEQRDWVRERISQAADIVSMWKFSE